MKNHFTIEIRCADYGFKSVKGNKVYVLTINGGKVQVETGSGSSSDRVGGAASPRSNITIIDVHHSTDKTLAFGVRAGLNMATTQFDSQYDSPSMTTAFHIGLSLDVPITEQFLFTTGLLYSAKGYKYDDGKVAESATAHYIDMPLLASYRLPIGSSLGLQFSAGPYVALGLGGSIKDDKASKYDQKFFDRNNTFDYGVQAGASLVVSRHFIVGAAYQLGLASYRNRNIMVSVGYNF